MAEYDDNMLNRLAKKIAIATEGIPESAFKEGGIVGKHIEVSDEYASKFADAIEKAKSLLNDDKGE